MRPVATDVARSVVCVYVRLSVHVLVTGMFCVKTAEPIEMPFGEDSCRPHERRIRWGRDSHGKGVILEVSRPIEEH